MCIQSMWLYVSIHDDIVMTYVTIVRDASGIGTETNVPSFNCNCNICNEIHVKIELIVGSILT